MVQKDISLARFTSFQIGGNSRLFCKLENAETLTKTMELFASERNSLFILGGGSNVLINDTGFDGLTLRIATRGIQISNNAPDNVIVVVEAGESWDKVVETCVNRNLWGIENLSHIPGTAGAAVVQNIGAYGQEISDVLISVDVYDLQEKRGKTLSAEECSFAYRRSIFNTSAVEKYLILRIHLNLSTIENPQLTYADVERYFNKIKIAHPSALEMRQGIIRIRDAKFPYPDYRNGGNAGSFFKNFKLNELQYEEVIRKVHDLAGGSYSARLTKSMLRTDAELRTLPTAVLIDSLGLKGYGRGGAQINYTQPLVILNKGTASAMDVLAVFHDVRQMIFKRFGLIVENEPQLVGFSNSELERVFCIE